MEGIFQQGRGDIEVFADDGCWANGRRDALAGYRLFFRAHDPRNVCGVPITGKQTNNRAHGFALLGALVLTTDEKDVTIVTCSRITVRTSLHSPSPKPSAPLTPTPFTPRQAEVFRDLSWYKSRGWRKSNGKPLMNIDMWEKIDIEKNKRPDRCACVCTNRCQIFTCVCRTVCIKVQPKHPGNTPQMRRELRDLLLPTLI